MSNFKIILFTAIVFISCCAFAHQTPEGLWAARSPFLGDKPIGKVKISLVNGKLIGELLEVYPLNANVDRFCWRRQSPTSGPVILCDYQESDGKWINGKIYESTTGTVYRSEITLSPNGNHLYVKGDMGMASAVAVWDRLNR
ncbi:MAG: DUF2147 domain-containing protein [Proteobacteria bacterium]|nr:DUF2147 domain-containing protein [Pseudomonadota bacterium]